MNERNEIKEIINYRFGNFKKLLNYTGWKAANNLINLVVIGAALVAAYYAVILILQMCAKI